MRKMENKYGIGGQRLMSGIGLFTLAAFLLAAPVLVGARDQAARAGGNSLQVAAAQNPVDARYEKFVPEVVTIKPSDPSAPARLLGIGGGGDHFGVRNGTVLEMPRFASSLSLTGTDGRVTGGPSWVNSERYDVDAKLEPFVADAMDKLPLDQRSEAMKHLMLAILTSRCQLSVHREVRELQVFTLVVAKGGPKPKEASAEEMVPHSAPGSDGRGGYLGPRMTFGRGSIVGQATTIPKFVYILQMYLGRTVIDKTGLTGNYNFALQYTPDEMGGPAPAASATAAEGQPTSTPGATGRLCSRRFRSNLG